MTGRVSVQPRRRAARTHGSGSSSTGLRLIYVDPRRFGTGQAVHGRRTLDEYLDARLGVEPLDDCSRPTICGADPGPDAPIKSFILDQRRSRGRQHLRRRGAVSRSDPSAAPGGPAVAEQYERCARRRSPRCRPASRREGRRSTTSGTSTAYAGPSRTSFSSTGARASRVGRAADDPEDGRRRARTYVCETCQPRPRRKRVRAQSQAADLRSASDRGARLDGGLDLGEATDSSPSMITCGKVIIPVCFASSTRPSGSRDRLTSENSTPRAFNRPFARAQ